MPRPLRIEYADAYYHVMNRGSGRRHIFSDSDYYLTFLEVLAEAHQRFGLQILCYCLMSNHYHLLVKTPEANLGRAMRHINGVYTQRHNRLKRTDGPLFRGRYKAICVEKDSYQPQLSRYIHRHPLAATLLDRLEDYPWSSYLDYITVKRPPAWLYKNEIYDQLHLTTRRRAKYKAFVEQGVDKEIKQFYGTGNQLAYLGSEAFRDWVYRQRKTPEQAVNRATRQVFRPSIDEIILQVVRAMHVTRETILTSGRGRVAPNHPRGMAMYLCLEKGGHTLKDIAQAFGLEHYGSASTIIKNFKLELQDSRSLRTKIKLLL